MHTKPLSRAVQFEVYYWLAMSGIAITLIALVSNAETRNSVITRGTPIATWYIRLFLCALRDLRKTSFSFATGLPILILISVALNHVFPLTAEQLKLALNTLQIGYVLLGASGFIFLAFILEKLETEKN
ncbi:hypothetical protein [Actibacterium mucosum]|uniref:hypothetical protein n=1 Tax=Actibacterium mucosum TaxID=1087332 RepID=UPI001268DFAA|nr:hypothetical protein [Actibacterium mucosum]